MFDSQFWQGVFFGNTMQVYGAAILVFFGVVIVFKIFQSLIVRRLRSLAKKTDTDIDDTLIEIVQGIRPSFGWFLGLYLALQLLSFHPFVERGITVLLIIVVIAETIAAVQVFITYLARRSLEEGERDPEKSSAVNALSLIAKVILWSIGLLFILSNLGVNVTSLVAGLGIGGIAIAFALQKILSDLFSSFAIHFDKPFVDGDFIEVGTVKGTVEKIGIKTTRLRSVEGEEIVLANTELTSAQIHNYKRMEKRRITVVIGVAYETPRAVLERIPAILDAVVQKVAGTDVDRSHLKAFNDSAIDFELVYYVDSREYQEYMTRNQQIHFGILEAFEKEKIVIAYPTRTVYMEKN